MANYIRNVLIFDGEPARVACMLDAIKSHDDDIDETDFPNKIGTIDFNTIIPIPAELDIPSVSDVDTYIAAYLKAATSDNYADYGIEALSEDAYKRYATVLLTKHNINVSCKHISDETLEKRLNTKDVALGKQYFTNLQKYGMLTRYEWCEENWDSKRNAYGFVPSSEPNAIIFHTAWVRALSVIVRLSEMYPDILFKYRWADENLCSNIGFGSSTGECMLMGGVISHKNIPHVYTREAYELAASIREESPEDYNLVYDAALDTYVPRR